MGKLENRVAVVTGGGSGLGRGMCIRFAAEGAKVIIADLKPEAAEETAAMIREQGGEALAVECNVLEAESIAAMVKADAAAFGKIDTRSPIPAWRSPPPSISPRRSPSGSFW